MKAASAFYVWTILIIGSACPKCATASGCDKTIPVKHLTEKRCVCTLCIKLCYDRHPTCLKGEECSMEPLECPAGFNCGKNPILSAVCKPFTECKKLPDSCQCPETGFLKDQNGCDTCLCNDPCKELKCPVDGECGLEGVQPGTDPDYTCPT